MRESILILFIVGGVFAAPLLCAAGIAAHECVCDPAECCDDDSFCEMDPCADGLLLENWRHEELDAAAPMLQPQTGVEPEADLHKICTYTAPCRRNLPFRDTDLPLRA